MEECLAYFRQALEQPGSVMPWFEWWQIHDAAVRQSFDRSDYLRLKFRRLDAARMILERIGRPAVEPKIHTTEREFCPQCGEKLFKVFPGEMPTREEFIAFGEKSGNEECRQGSGLHHGLYCPRKCFWVMIEFRHPNHMEFWEQFKEKPKDALD